MFTQQLPAGVFKTQREFNKAMDANRDFVWWADTLIVEEVKELREAFEAEDVIIPHVLKELADVIYVVAGFYNMMPSAPMDNIPDETNERLQSIISDAAYLVSEVTQQLRIPLPILVAAFEVVHASNMSKLDENGKPIRRDDGKVMKGPNYVVPDMQPLTDELKKFHSHLKAQEILGNVNGKGIEDAEIRH